MVNAWPVVLNLSAILCCCIPAIAATGSAEISDKDETETLLVRCLVDGKPVSGRVAIESEQGTAKIHFISEKGTLVAHPGRGRVIWLDNALRRTTTDGYEGSGNVTRDARSIDLHLRPTRIRSLRVRLVGEDGSPLGGETLRITHFFRDAMNLRGDERVDKDGYCNLYLVPNGRYCLSYFYEKIGVIQRDLREQDVDEGAVIEWVIPPLAKICFKLKLYLKEGEHEEPLTEDMRLILRTERSGGGSMEFVDGEVLLQVIADKSESSRFVCMVSGEKILLDIPQRLHDTYRLAAESASVVVGKPGETAKVYLEKIKWSEIAIRVTDKDGAEVPGARAFARSEEMSVELGIGRRTKLAPGDYNLIVTKDGYRPHIGKVAAAEGEVDWSAVIQKIKQIKIALVDEKGQAIIADQHTHIQRVYTDKNILAGYYSTDVFPDMDGKATSYYDDSMNGYMAAYDSFGNRGFVFLQKGRDKYVIKMLPPDLEVNFAVATELLPLGLSPDQLRVVCFWRQYDNDLLVPWMEVDVPASKPGKVKLHFGRYVPIILLDSQKVPEEFRHLSVVCRPVEINDATKSISLIPQKVEH